MGLDDLEPILQAGLPTALHWRMKLYEDETHDSLKLKATYDALKFAYDGYTQDPVDVVPADGIMAKERPVRLTVFARRINLHYTMDGSEPTNESPRFDGGPITISDPSKARLKLISTRGVFDREIAVHLRFGVPLAPARDHRLAESGKDWRYALYPQEIKAAGKPVREGTTVKDLSLKDLGHERVAGRLDRNLVVPADGDFVFAVRASQPRLRLGGTMLISDDGPDNQGIRTFIAPLRQGTYPLSLEFVTATDNPSLYLAVFRCTDDQPEWWTQRPWVELSGR